MFNKGIGDKAQNSFKIAVLVSAGRHPVSARARRAVNDAQALELGLRLAAQYPATLHVLHAGQIEETALRPYLGMGIPALEILDVPPDVDILPALAARLRELQPLLILTGVRTEAGWSSGCLPYVLARALGMPIVPNADQIDLIDSGATVAVRQVLARGQRRGLDMHLPGLVTIHAAAPAPRQSAFARARRGPLRVNSVSVDAVVPPFFGEIQPARKRPKRLRVATATTAAERLRAITETAAGQGRIVEPGTLAEAARIIHGYLTESGLLKPRS